MDAYVCLLIVDSASSLFKFVLCSEYINNFFFFLLCIMIRSAMLVINVCLLYCDCASKACIRFCRCWVKLPNIFLYLFGTYKWHHCSWMSWSIHLLWPLWEVTIVLAGCFKWLHFMDNKQVVLEHTKNIQNSQLEHQEIWKIYSMSWMQVISKKPGTESPGSTCKLGLLL